MKKLNLLILFSLFSFYSYAKVPTEVYVGGKFNFSGVSVGQDAIWAQEELPRQPSGSGSGTNYNHLDKDNYLTQEAFIDFLAIGKTDNAALYGGRATIQLNSKRGHLAKRYGVTGGTSENEVIYTDSNNPVFTRRAYMFLEKKSTGRIEAGDVEGPSKKMKFDASYRFGGTGGISGNWWRYVNIPDFGLAYQAGVDDGIDTCSSSYATNDIRYCGSGGQGNKSFIIRPDLPLSHGYTKLHGADQYDDTRTIARISYYSPRVSGVQVGIGYSPDSSYRGASYYKEPDNINTEAGNVRDIVDGAINYVEQFGDLGVAVSLTGEIGYADDTTQVSDSEFLQTDLSAFALGTYIFYGNLSASASYGTWNDSLMMVRGDLTSNDSDYREDDANYYTLGLGYQFGPYRFGLSHMASTYREQEFSLTSAAFDYYLSKDFALYAEYNDYAFEARDVDPDNSISTGLTYNNEGEVILVGAKFKFGEFDSASQILLDTSQDLY